MANILFPMSIILDIWCQFLIRQVLYSRWTASFMHKTNCNGHPKFKFIKLHFLSLYPNGYTSKQRSHAIFIWPWIHFLEGINFQNSLRSLTWAKKNNSHSCCQVSWPYSCATFIAPPTLFFTTISCVLQKHKCRYPHFYYRPTF